MMFLKYLSIEHFVKGNAAVMLLHVLISAVLIYLICISLFVLSSCSVFNNISVNNNELKIGVSGISGQFNPFYCETQADKQIVAQTARPI